MIATEKLLDLLPYDGTLLENITRASAVPKPKTDIIYILPLLEFFWGESFHFCNYIICRKFTLKYFSVNIGRYITRRNIIEIYYYFPLPRKTYV